MRTIDAMKLLVQALGGSSTANRISQCWQELTPLIKGLDTFNITVTYSSSTWSCDKKYTEIKSKLDSGKTVNLVYDGVIYKPVKIDTTNNQVIFEGDVTTYDESSPSAVRKIFTLTKSTTGTTENNCTVANNSISWKLKLS